MDDDKIDNNNNDSCLKYLGTSKKIKVKLQHATPVRVLNEPQRAAESCKFARAIVAKLR